jgi:hypothetical protein
MYFNQGLAITPMKVITCDNVLNFEVVGIKDYFFIGLSKGDAKVTMRTT